MRLPQQARRRTSGAERFRPALVLLAVLLSLGVARAGDPWKEKAYREWNEKDVKKVLTDSPWARTVHVNAVWKQGGSADDERALSTGGLRVGETGAAPRGAGGPRSAEEPPIPQALFHIRWVSAQTIRQAMARSAVLSGKVGAEEADRFWERRSEQHVIAIVGQDMRPFARVHEDSLKSATYLIVKSSRQKLAPSRVEIHRAPDGTTVTAVAFSFARTSPSGEELIGPDEKDLEFSCEANRVLFKTNFNVQKMTGKNGLDL